MTGSNSRGAPGGNAGGLCASSPTTDLSFVTIAGNSAGTVGGGLYVANFSISPPRRLKGVLIAGNTAPTGPDCYGTGSTSLGFNLIGDATSCGIVSIRPHGNFVRSPWKARSGRLSARTTTRRGSTYA